MSRITNEMIHAAYDIAKQIFDDVITQKTGLNHLASQYQMNRNSAADYIQNYKCMLEGRRFSRTSNAYGTEYFLQKIYVDGGRAALLNALSALSQHIDYYESIGNTTLHKQREIVEKFSKVAEVEVAEIFPDEVSDINLELLEGKTKKVSVNIYERNPIARQQCIDHYGCKCVVCSFSFEEKFREIGKSFIHVHHLIEISTINTEYSINPIKDLRPVCPNCHAMLHKRKPSFSIEELKAYLESR